ncbi:hypothetical protein Hanom_Chr16g01447921 [Helianthus anomalus]
MSDQFRIKILTIQTQYNAQPFRGKFLNHSDICSRNKQTKPLNAESVRRLNHGCKTRSLRPNTLRVSATR